MTGSHDEILRLRDADDQADDDAGRASADAANFLPGAERRTGTVIVNPAVTYPLHSFYKIAEVAITGTEAEGSPATETPTGVVFPAFYLGPTPPINGARVTATLVPYRWTFG